MEGQIQHAKEEVKKVYRMMDEIVQENPQLYIMPKEVYNSIMKKIASLDREVDRARKSRDSWRKKYQDKK